MRFLVVVLFSACANDGDVCVTQPRLLRDCSETPTVDVLIVMHDTPLGIELAELFDHDTLIAGLRDPVSLGIDAPPIEDVHVGVITDDLGSGSTAHELCPSVRGENGELRATSRDGVACTTDGRPFVDGTSVSGEAIECMLAQGDEGCRWGQSLESIVRAIVGHDGGANAGFVRRDALLAVFFVASIDDCSAIDPALHADGPGTTTRCISQPDLLAPLERYECFFDAKGSGRDPVVGGLLPVPLDWGGNLEDPRLTWSGDPEDYVCSSGDGRSYWAAPRLASLVDPGAATSSCTSDFREASLRFARAVHERLAQRCR